MNSKLSEQMQNLDIKTEDKTFYIDQKINNENNNDIYFQKKSNSNFPREIKIDSKTQTSIQKFNSQEEKKYKTNINFDQWEQIQKYFLNLKYDDVSQISFLPFEDQIFIQNEKTKFNIEEKIKKTQELLKKWQKWFNESQIKINDLQKKLNSLPDLKIFEDELQKLINLENQRLYPNHNNPNINPQIKKYDFDTEHQKLQLKIIQIIEQKENIYKEIEKEKENQKRFSKIIDEIEENHHKEIQYNIQYIKNNFYIQQL
ncbi:hypothetical protein OC683_02065 ['Crotalaria aegyptiaca' phytoplasma]|uniref:Uncharacterized protein n=1 Tax=Candidatus Phytoplasma crotalariae TaxID=2982627 RepID=A0ABT9D2Y4_9MOLU|nr:hypothetical protein ['Crotalaria aegyptiaca' phytoplasma]MDO8059381.1 hypothetical protein ['Crotalaria aegyptiaca' phytoplasma]